MIDFLDELLVNQYGEDICRSIINGYVVKRATTLRVNTEKTSVEEIKEKLAGLNISFYTVSWSEDALIIENADEGDIRKLEFYENGEIYLQSLSSMIPPVVVSPSVGESILDMAAAPGGKTTQMFNLSGGQAMITACEKNKIRADRLKYNLDKQGAKKVTVMVQDARKLDDFFSFDKILLDAPCSGSGTLDMADKDLEKTFTKELISRSVRTQKELIKKASKILKVNGELVYSTCSILKEENEEVVREVLSKGNMEIVPIDKDEFDGIPLLPVSLDGTICVCPDKLYEGFFVAKLRKIRK